MIRPDPVWRSNGPANAVRRLISQSVGARRAQALWARELNADNAEVPADCLL